MKKEDKRWFIELSYDGGTFSGWQRQNNAPSVQQSIEEALTLALQQKTEIVGCGRTDAGVHARSFFAHFDSTADIDPANLCFKLNSILGKTIGIQRITQVDNKLHARFDATARTYQYHVLFKKDPFTIDQAHYIYGKQPNIELMNKASAELLGEKDFSCFEKIGSDNSTSICHVTSATWAKTDAGALFEISANRFLRNMVRAIVGTLLEVGLETRTLAEFKTLLSTKERSNAGASAPAKGLFLHKIAYPNICSYE